MFNHRRFIRKINSIFIVVKFYVWNLFSADETSIKLRYTANSRSFNIIAIRINNPVRP